MKNLIFSLVTLLIFTQAQGEAVIDWDGNTVLTGETYYVLPVDRIPGLGGGVEPYAVSNVTCQYGVSQTQNDDGIPVKLGAVGDQGCEIHEDTDLDISFPSSIGCSPSSLWTRGDYDNTTGQYLVLIGEKVTGIVNGGGAFRIQRIEDSYTYAHHYKLVYCPQACACCLRPKCADVEISSQDGVRRLAVISGETSFHILFYRYVPPKMDTY